MVVNESIVSTEVNVESRVVLKQITGNSNKLDYFHEVNFSK